MESGTDRAELSIEFGPTRNMQSSLCLGVSVAKDWMPLGFSPFGSWRDKGGAGDGAVSESPGNVVHGRGEIAIFASFRAE